VLSVAVPLPLPLLLLSVATDPVAPTPLEPEPEPEADAGTDTDDSEESVPTLVETMPLDENDCTETDVGAEDSAEVSEAMGDWAVPDMWSSVKNPENEVYGRDVSFKSCADSDASLMK